MQCKPGWARFWPEAGLPTLLINNAESHCPQHCCLVPLKTSQLIQALLNYGVEHLQCVIRGRDVQKCFSGEMGKDLTGDALENSIIVMQWEVWLLAPVGIVWCEGWVTNTQLTCFCTFVLATHLHLPVFSGSCQDWVASAAQSETNREGAWSCCQKGDSAKN